MAFNIKINTLPQGLQVQIPHCLPVKDKEWAAKRLSRYENRKTVRRRKDRHREHCGFQSRVGTVFSSSYLNFCKRKCMYGNATRKVRKYTWVDKSLVYNLKSNYILNLLKSRTLYPRLFHLTVTPFPLWLVFILYFFWTFKYDLLIEKGRQIIELHFTRTIA